MGFRSYRSQCSQKSRWRSGKPTSTSNQAQQQASQQQIEAQQRQIEALQQQKQQPQSQPQQEDVTQKLQKYADLHQKGILSDEEFQKLKADLLSKM